MLVAVQAGAEHLQVDPGAATADAETEATTAQVVEQGGLLGERDRVAVGEHAHGGAHQQAAGAAEEVGGEGDRRGVVEQQLDRAGLGVVAGHAEVVLLEGPGGEQPDPAGAAFQQLVEGVALDHAQQARAAAGRVVLTMVFLPLSAPDR